MYTAEINDHELFDRAKVTPVKQDFISVYIDRQRERERQTETETETETDRDRDRETEREIVELS